MINCNPETVSTDAESSDRLFFEPLTIEDVLEVVERERPVGVVVMFGGQTPLRLAQPAGGRPACRSWERLFRPSTSPRTASALGACSPSLGCAPRHGVARDAGHAAELADGIGYPVLVRPSYVLGGREMRICYDRDSLLSRPVQPGSADRPVRRGRDQVDVDAVCDGERTLVAAVMQHVEEAGVHSGDSTCVIPTLSLGEQVEQEIERQTAAIAQALGERGLINVQFAVQGPDVYVLEANPRASRTVPFVSKATGQGVVEAAVPGGARTRGQPAAGGGQPRQCEGRRAALPAVLRGRSHPRPRDALHR